MGMARNSATKEESMKKKEQKKKQTKPVEIDYAAIEHPYVVTLNKKLRAFKKKQEKIKSLEDSLKGQTKQLNEQQLEVLANKNFVEKMCAELEALRQQFVEILLDDSNKEEDAAPVSEEGDVSSLNHLNEDVSDTKDAAEELTEEDELNATPSPAPVDEEEKLEYVHSILKLLHAVTLHQALGHDVPTALDYFTKVLMGKTRPPVEVSFPENLAESMEEAKRYVNKSDKIVALDMSYRDLAEAVDALVTPKPAPVVEEPHINFFTESELDKKTDDAAPVSHEEVAVEEETFVVVDVEKPAPETKTKRPNSGNRRHKNNTSPREGNEGEKPQRPRKVYQPRQKPQGSNGEQQATATAAPEGGRAPRNHAPKANSTTSPSGDQKQRSSNRRPNSKQGDRPRPKKVEQEVTP